MAAINYCIRVQGHLASEWSEWFGGMIIQRQPEGTTTLTGPVRDQAALHGLLLKVRDLGLPLISVEPAPDLYIGGKMLGLDSLEILARLSRVTTYRSWTCSM